MKHVVDIERVERNQELAKVTFFPPWWQLLLGRRVFVRFATINHDGSCRWEWMPPYHDPIPDDVHAAIDLAFWRARAARTARRMRHRTT